MSTFSSEIHRPSAEKLWQQPAMEEEVFPIFPGLDSRRTPLEVQAASYLAASVRIASLSSRSISSCLASAAGLVDPLYQTHELPGKGGDTNESDDPSESSHSWFLQIKLLFYSHYKSNNRSCQEKIEQIF